jgi:hypothetical protein
VLRIEALGDRKQDRTLNCTPAATG